MRSRTARTVVASFAAYAVAGGSLVVIDAFQATTGTAAEASAWALFRSLVLIVGPLTVLGLDQAAIRRRVPARELFSLPILHVLGIALLSGAVWWPARGYPGVGYVTGSSAIFGLLLLVAGVLRSQMRVAAGIWVMHSWKFVLLVMIGVSLALSTEFDILKLGFYSLSGSLVLSLLFLVGRTAETARARYPPEVQKLRGQYRVSLRFTASSVIVSAGVYIDQILLNLGASDVESQTWLLHMTFFATPLVFVQGYLSNLLAPYARNRPDWISDNWRRLLFGSLVGSVMLALFAGIAGWAVAVRFADLDGVSFMIATGCLLIGMLRLLQLVPTTVVGVFGDRRMLDRFLVVALLGVGSMPPIFWLTVFFGGSPLAAVFCSVTFGVAARTGASAWLAIALLRRGDRLDPKAAFG